MQPECCHLLMFAFLVFKAPAFSMHQPNLNIACCLKMTKVVYRLINLAGSNYANELALSSTPPIVRHKLK